MHTSHCYASFSHGRHHPDSHVYLSHIASQGSLCSITGVCQPRLQVPRFIALRDCQHLHWEQVLRVQELLHSITWYFDVDGS